jgi:hypothetical protein
MVTGMRCACVLVSGDGNALMIDCGCVALALNICAHTVQLMFV